MSNESDIKPVNGEIKVVNVALNGDAVFSWLTLGDGAYMTTQDVAEMLGVTAGYIRKAVGERGLLVASTSSDQLRQLKELGAVPFKTTVANLLPEVTIDRLVKIIDTPEANEIWTQILNKVRNREVTGDMATVFARMLDLEGSVALRDDQVNVLLDAMRAKYDEVGFKYKGKAEPTMMIIQSKVKVWAFPETPKNHCKWREMPRAKFDGALEFINSYQPTDSDRSWYKKILKDILRRSY